MTTDTTISPELLDQLLANYSKPEDLTGESGDLAAAVEAAAYGHAMLLLEGDYGKGDEAVELAADRAARSTLALVESRHLLRGQTP